MNSERVAVRNASDPQQVGAARRREHRRERDRAAHLAAVMETYEGRAALMALLEDAKLYVNVFDPDAAIMAFNAGVQNAGQRLLARMLQASEGNYELAEREARVRRRSYEQTTEAAQTQRAIDQADGGGNE